MPYLLYNLFSYPSRALLLLKEWLVVIFCWADMCICENWVQMLLEMTFHNSGDHIWTPTLFLCCITIWVSALKRWHGWVLNFELEIEQYRWRQDPVIKPISHNLQVRQINQTCILKVTSYLPNLVEWDYTVEQWPSTTLVITYEWSLALLPCWRITILVLETQWKVIWCSDPEWWCRPASSHVIFWSFCHCKRVRMIANDAL